MLMEENTNLEESFFDLHISEGLQWSLTQAAKWARLIAFFASGIMLLVLAYLVILFQMPQVAANGLITYTIIALIAVLAVIGCIIGMLINFASKIKRGISEQDIESVEKGMASLKFYFVIAGILYIIFILFFILGLTQRIYRG